MSGIVFTMMNGSSITIPENQLDVTINSVLKMTKKTGWVLYDSGTRAVNMDHVITVAEMGGGPQPGQFVPINNR